MAIEHLHNYLFDLEFTLINDHTPLPTMLNPHSNKSLPLRQHLAWRMHQYTFRIQHIVGNANTADSLSRLPSEQNDFSDTGLVCKDYIRFVFTSNM